MTAASLFLLLTVTAGATAHHDAVDDRVSTSAHHIAVAHPWLVAAANAATALGSTTCLVLVIALAGSLLRMTMAMIALVVCAASSAALVNAINTLTARPRPSFSDPLSRAGGYGFPSGHATNGTVVYGLLLLIATRGLRSHLVRRWIIVGGATLIAAISASLVMLGVHWASDVLAGVALGVTILTLARRASLHAPSE